MAVSLLCLLAFGRTESAELSSVKDYSTVDAVITKHCLDCHAAQDPEGKLVMESFEDLIKGGESGVAIVPGKSDDSLLVKMIEGRFEKDGKKKIMPPGKRKKLETEEIATIKAWIDAGAKPPREVKVRELVTPKIVPKGSPRLAINALAYAASPGLIAVARYGEVELRSADSRAVVRTLRGHRGSVNALVFSADGAQLFAAAGEPGLFGEVRQWKVSDGALIRTFEGHKDALYSVALSPDGQTLATGSYDQKIKLWKVETGEETRTLAGHNGAVFDLAFRPDGKILASASADRTVKLWDVATGDRRDTLSQSLKELHTVAFSPDGKRLFAGGVDNRIRVWQISETAAETTNPILDAKFAHEGAVLNLVFSTDGKTLLSSADDRTVKLWDADPIQERLVLEKQPDWPPALTFASDNKAVVVGRLDGTLEYYDATSGKVMPPPKPELARAEPRGIQRGVEAKIKLVGAKLGGLTELKFHHAKLTGELLREKEEQANEAWIKVLAAPDLARGSYELSVVGPNGESGKVKLHVDDLPQVYPTAAGDKATHRTVHVLPASFWGAHEKIGDTDQFEFEAAASQAIVFDVAAKKLGSKADPVITLFDATGKVLASNNGFDGSTDPLLAYTFDTAGRYRVQVNELLLGASVDHFYRMSAGAFPYVVGCYPLSVPANAETEVELIGHNLPLDRKLKVKAEKPGEMELPVDPEKFRTRRTIKLIVSESADLAEVEPNDQPEQATIISAPGAVGGRIWKAGQTFGLSRTTETRGQKSDSQKSTELSQPVEKGSTPVLPFDVDLFKFETKAGRAWIIETAAAQRGSPIDTRIEVLHQNGKPVERLLLQAVRDSHVTFRGIDSNSSDCRVENWEEMELNQYLYLQGEVVKLFRAPQGPDSGFQFYTSNGKRRTYFDTSATAHANDEPCYIVEPHPPGAKLVNTGLPVFPLYYANDDDGERKLGTDSKLHFTAPADGAYLVRVSDTRGYGGDRFAYRLVIREAHPDFKVTLNGANPKVNAGSGQSFSVSVERIDGFDSEIKVEISGLPAGFSVSAPLIIQTGHAEAKGTINAALDAPSPNETNAAASKVIATAIVKGQKVMKAVNNLGKITLAERPKLFVSLEPSMEPVAGGGIGTNDSTAANAPQPLEIVIAPGQTAPAWLKVQRNGHEDLITFAVDNLPHGVIVDNIGLNGVLIPKDQNERQIFLSAAKWVPETDRLCYAVENQAGRQTSLPVLLKVRKAGAQLSATSKP